MSVDPRGMPDVIAWADATILTLSDSWAFGRLDDPDQWRDWATAFVRASPFAQQNPPDPYAFDDWRLFAERVYSYLEKVST